MKSSEQRSRIDWRYIGTVANLGVSVGVVATAVILAAHGVIGLVAHQSNDAPVKVEIVHEDGWDLVTGQEHADMVEAGVIDADTVCKVSVPFGDSALTMCDNGHTEES